jgi:hypothetical protein
MDEVIDLKISGHSDDIVMWEMGGKGDELYPPNNGDSPYAGTMLIHSPSGRCRVHVLYDGCWSFALCKVDEGDPNLWPVAFGWEGYSQTLTLKVPTGTKVSWE